MAVAPHDVLTTRDQVSAWIDEWNSDHGDKTLDQHIHDRVDELALEDPYVNTSGHESLPDQMLLADLIMLDIHSYRNYAS